MEIQIAVLSKQGGRERNEDSCGYWNRGGPVCCVLSDGAGGHGGGDVASRIAVDTVLASFSSTPDCSPAGAGRLIELANREVINGQSSSERVRDMRATLVILAVDPAARHAVWGHVGDSRLYVFRDGYVVSRTRDHSLVQTMVDAGFIDPAKLRTSPDRGVLVASLGGEDGNDYRVTPEPMALQPGDAFLLCSDGFWDYVGDRDMEAALLRAATPQAWLEDMERAVAHPPRPGQDNYTALALWYGPMEFTTRKLAPAAPA